MQTYTVELQNKINTFSTREADYNQELIDAMQRFRSCDQALDAFIKLHGFSGNIHSIQEKVSFIKNKFKEKGEDSPRFVEEWYTEHKPFLKKTGMQICFVFDLSEEETRDFFRRICFDRAFDLHTVEDVVYLYGIRNHLKYRECADIIGQIPKLDKQRIVDMDTAIYTEEIEEEINEISSIEELKEYISYHKDIFSYNNVTAYSNIQTLWNQIAGENGLVYQEKYESYDREEIGDVPVIGRKVRKRDDHSTLSILFQILGLKGELSAKLYSERGIKRILGDNSLVHKLVAEDFPDRNSIEKILRGEHVSYGKIRKILVLLSFYVFWAGSEKDRGGDKKNRCKNRLDMILIESGYEPLYLGNPYDFMFLCSMEEEEDYMDPLENIRGYMRELNDTIILHI
ncbi:MAG: hypothetical protein MJ105_06570 [Lachnospiraceae bacterium]|nr:hypothetical protein [Lachnospiraceae bacterium]